MDQELDIYVNADYQVSANVNADEICTLKPDGPRSVPSTHEATPRDLRKSYCRAVAVFLGFLVLLLLTQLIIQVVLANRKGSECKMEFGLLQTSHNNLTAERDQLQTSYNILRQERDQLQKRVENLVASLQTLPQEMSGWHYFSSSIYYIPCEEKTWQQSRDDCLQRGADLVVINSREEQKFLEGFKKRLWIGLSDIEREGTWKWVDGTPLTTSYWARGEPDDLHGEDCAEITNWLDNWNDFQCHKQLSWVCEKRLRPNP